MKFHTWAHITEKSYKKDHKVLIHYKAVNLKLIKLNNLLNI